MAPAVFGITGAGPAGERDDYRENEFIFHRELGHTDMVQLSGLSKRRFDSGTRAVNHLEIAEQKYESEDSTRYGDRLRR